MNAFVRRSVPGLVARSFLCLTLALGLIAGCERQSPQSSGGADAAPAPQGDTIKVGHFGTLTGNEATFGQSTDKGVKMAFDEANAEGGINGKKLELISRDTRGRTEDSGSAVTRLIDSDKVVALLGEVASGRSIAGGRVAQAKGIPMISPASTNPDVTAIGDKIFRVCFIDPFQGFVVAKFASENLKVKKVAILYDQSQAYSTGLRKNFVEAFTKMGGTITTEQAYSGGDQDFSAQLTTIRETAPQAIFIPGYYSEVGNIALQAKKLGIHVPMLGGDGWDSAELLQIAGEALEGSFFSNHFSEENPRPEQAAFIERYRAKWSERPDAMAALGYDAAKILVEAMKKAPSLKSDELAAAIAATKDFPGVTGMITIDANRNARKSAVMLEIKGGKLTFAASIDPE